MFRDLDIRYGKTWVRLLCCITVAMVIWRLIDVGKLRTIERTLYFLLLSIEAGNFQSAAEGIKTFLLFLLCLSPAIGRVEQPAILLLTSIMYGLLYILFIMLALYQWNYIFPVAAPLIGLFFSTALLETMAWSEERRRRRDLEDMETAKQNFTDMLVHDLSSRMSSISMSYKMLEKKLHAKDPDMTQLLDTISSSSKRMLTQIHALLDIRKIEEGKMILHKETVRLTDFLLNQIDDFKPAAEFLGLRLELVTPEDVATRIEVDRDIFARVLANLFWNALQHAAKGSLIEVSYGTGTPHRIEIAVGNRGQTIPPEQQEVIFEKFVSGSRDIKNTHLAGSGLGLAFCKLAVEAHGGHIAMVSPWEAYGDGAQVRLTLPKPNLPAAEPESSRVTSA